MMALNLSQLPRHRFANGPAMISRIPKLCCPLARHQVTARADGVAEMKSALTGDVDPAYQEGSAFLKLLDPEISPAEVARVLDIAMNPNSIFVSFRDKKRAKNANARRLSVSDDMEPVVEFLRGQSLTDKQIAAIVVEHPPTLSYSIPDRLQPFVDCLAGVGVDDIARVIRERPSILGLEADNVRSIVDYLQSRGESQEAISEYLRISI